MKSWTLRFREIDKKNFDQVKNGSKPVETRAATVKYQPIKVGDKLVFVCGKEKFEREVVSKRHFQSIDEMITEIPYTNIMPNVNSVEELKAAYHSYNGYEEKIREFGLFAFELK